MTIGGAKRTDVLSPEQRKHCMSRIRSSNTRPEITLRKALWHKGLRYRIRSKVLGKPDIAFVSSKVAVFVDGCFWHCCPMHSVRPQTNTRFWVNKLHRNSERDAEVNAKLAKLGWRVLRFWEHEVEDDAEAVASRIASVIKRRSRQVGRNVRCRKERPARQETGQ